jgi:hypothetical protein
LIIVIALFVILVAAAIYQFSLGGRGEPLCGPASPGAAPTPGSCVQPTPATPTST